MSAFLSSCHEWHTAKLCQLVKMVSGGTPSMQVEAYWNGDVPWFSAKDLKSFRLSSAQVHLTAMGVTAGSRLVPENSILLLVRGMTLLKDVPVGLTSRPVAFNQDLKALLPNSTTEPAFLAYWLVANKKRLMSLVDVAGHGTGRLPTELLNDVKVSYPPLPEQRRIVEILDEADAAVRTTEALIAAKLKHKRAWAERLLTGKVRFPEFARQAWGKVKIGSLLQEVERPITWDDEEHYDLVSIRRRSEGVFHRGRVKGEAIKTKNLKRIKTGDFLISKMQVVHGAWGLVTPEFDDYHVSESYITLVPKPGVALDMPFFSWLSQLPQTYRLALVSSHGVHIEKMTFNLELLFRERVLIPSDVAEQQKIAEVLLLMDEEIALLRRQLALLKAQKQGLMQKLLTGEVRVKEFAP